MFCELGSFEDSSERVMQIDYSAACTSMQAGSYSDAIAMFESLGNYSDSLQNIEHCYICIADSQFEQGDYENARKNYEAGHYDEGIKKADTAWGDLLFSKNDFENAAGKWSAYAGDPQIDEKLLSADYELALIAAENGDLQRCCLKQTDWRWTKEQGRAAQSLLFMDISKTVPIAASETHIAYIDINGIVHADGDNTHSQCDVEQWQGVVSLCVSEQNTYGLKYDGTVVAAGSNAFSQCEVGSWTGIVSLCASVNAVFGLKNDGTIVFAGPEGWYDAVSEWTDIKQICAGTQHIAALDSSGKVYATGKNDYGQCSLGEAENIAGIACGPMHTVLIDSDGSVTVKGVSGAFEDYLKDISGAISASSSWSHLVVQHSDGSLSAYGADERGQCAVSDWTDIAFYTARANFTVGVKSDSCVVTTVAGHSLDWRVLIWK